MNSRHAALVTMGLAVLWGMVCLPRPAAADESENQSAARIAAMTPEQKEKLLQKKERFEALSPKEREHLRQLHEEISTHPDADRLQGVLSRYNQWLKTLTSAQQAEVMSLPVDQRVAKIKTIRQSQLQAHFMEVAVRLEQGDLDTIYAWIEDFVARHEEEILSRIDPSTAARIVATLDTRLRHRQLLDVYFRSRRSPGPNRLPTPTDEDFQRLAGHWSETLESQLAVQSTDDNRRALVMTCAGYAHFRRYAPPPPSDTELRKFYATLNPQERERLDKLDERQMKWELTGLYWRSRARGGQWGRSPGTGGERGGGFGTQGKGTPPPRANGKDRPGRDAPEDGPIKPAEKAEAKEPPPQKTKSAE